MKTIRHNCFETNSSSMHSLCFSNNKMNKWDEYSIKRFLNYDTVIYNCSIQDNEKDNYDFSVEDPIKSNHIKLMGQEFGRRYRWYNDPHSKLCYLVEYVMAAQERLSYAKLVKKEKTKDKYIYKNALQDIKDYKEFSKLTKKVLKNKLLEAIKIELPDIQDILYCFTMEYNEDDIYCFEYVFIDHEAVYNKTMKNAILEILNSKENLHKFIFDKNCFIIEDDDEHGGKTKFKLPK